MGLGAVADHPRRAASAAEKAALPRKKSRLRMGIGAPWMNLHGRVGQPGCFCSGLLCFVVAAQLAQRAGKLRMECALLVWVPGREQRLKKSNRLIRMPELPMGYTEFHLHPRVVGLKHGQLLQAREGFVIVPLVQRDGCQSSQGRRLARIGGQRCQCGASRLCGIARCIGGLGQTGKKPRVLWAELQCGRVLLLRRCRIVTKAQGDIAPQLMQAHLVACRTQPRIRACFFVGVTELEPKTRRLHVGAESALKGFDGMGAIAGTGQGNAAEELLAIAGCGRWKSNQLFPSSLGIEFLRGQPISALRLGCNQWTGRFAVAQAIPGIS